MHLRMIISAITIIVSIDSIPFISSASDIAWSNEHYEATAGAAYSDPFGTFYYDIDTNTGPPLPVISSSSLARNSAYAEILESSMYVYSTGPYVELLENPLFDGFARVEHF